MPHGSASSGGPSPGQPGGGPSRSGPSSGSRGDQGSKRKKRKLAASAPETSGPSTERRALILEDSDQVRRRTKTRRRPRGKSRTASLLAPDEELLSTDRKSLLLSA